MHKTTFYSAIIVLLALLAIPVTVSADTNSSTTIYVNVQSVSEITLSPSALSWNNAQPGHAAISKLLDIVNTGSLNVTNLYSFISTLSDESRRPYGTGNPTNYSAGGVIVMENNSYEKYFFAGRIEWNETKDISNMKKDNVNNASSWGFFRNTSYEYNWLVGQNSTNGRCNETGAEFAFSDLPDNGTEVTRTPTTTNINPDGADENYGYFSVVAPRTSSPLYESCIAVSSDCTKIYIYRYDERNGFKTCGNARYIQVLDLAPGIVHTLNLTAYVPLGIPNGNLNTTTFTVVAT
jgi:hypothetical protein